MDATIATSVDVDHWLRSYHPRRCEGACISKPLRASDGWVTAPDGTPQVQTSASGGNNLAPTLPATLKRPLPQPPIDLNKGLDTYIPKDTTRHCGVEALIHAAQATGTPMSSFNYLTYRNNLNKIMGTIFNRENEWAVDACVVTHESLPTTLVFLDIVGLNETEQKFQNFDNDKFMAWGYIFESILTGVDITDPNTDYSVLVKWKLTPARTQSEVIKPFTVLMGAEIDCYDLEEHPSAADGSNDVVESYVELKTTTMPRHPGQYRTLYGKRYPKWWLQSFLAGVGTIVVGMRDHTGIVHELKTIKTLDMPRIAWTNGARWFPDQALAFGAHVLSWMTSVTQTMADTHIRFTYDPNDRKITYKRIETIDELRSIHSNATALLPERIQRVL